MSKLKNNWPNSKQFPKIIKSKDIALDQVINLNISKNCQEITNGRVILQISFLSKAPTPVSNQRKDVGYRPLFDCFLHTYSSPNYCD